MLGTLRAAPSPSGRGELSFQPAYFTSSLFVDPLREDINELVRVYTYEYNRAMDTETFQPFTLFKTVWNQLGWSVLHFKVIEPRGRLAFMDVVIRLFLELACADDREVLERVVCLFGLYTFHMTQPSCSSPVVQGVQHIPIAFDLYKNLVAMPTLVAEHDKRLIQQTKVILKTLKHSFVLMPKSTLHPNNPLSLPRELFRAVAENEPEDNQMKKVGRPSKRDVTNRVRVAVNRLDKWVEKSPYPIPDASNDPAGAPIGVRALCQSRTEGSGDSEDDVEDFEFNSSTTHILLSQRPMISLQDYRQKKDELVAALEAHGGGALLRASDNVVARLQHIDRMAAERGLEVGSEGGELSGLGRVEKASHDFEGGRRGLLGLLEGNGLE